MVKIFTQWGWKKRDNTVPEHLEFVEESVQKITNFGAFLKGPNNTFCRLWKSPPKLNLFDMKFIHLSWTNSFFLFGFLYHVPEYQIYNWLYSIEREWRRARKGEKVFSLERIDAKTRLSLSWILAFLSGQVREAEM